VGLGTLDDGLALTPPMGWNSWNRFGPFISEQLVLDTADALIESGMRDAGYRYVVIDDAWESSARDDNGDLAENLWSFPHGMKWLADRIHDRGLKFGLYTDAGTKTCQGYPGSRGNEARDARHFASLGVDFMKVDWCHTEGLRGRTTYPLWSDAIAASGRKIVLSICEWGRDKPWEWAGECGHMWRTSGDIQDSWGSLLSVVEKQVELHAHAGPGHWNDPDMLEVGNGGMTDEEYRTHFSLWAMLAAPLMAGNDLREMSDATREILTAREVIAIDQDARGSQGRRVSRNDTTETWARPLADGSYAVLLLNRGDEATNVRVLWEDVLGTKGSRGGHVRDLWDRADVGERDGWYDRTLEPHACALVKVTFR
jgi:alpha-galactosidase